jgi:hypothetical protein
MDGRTAVARALAGSIPVIYPKLREGVVKENYVVIGDIHGCYDLLLGLLGQVAKSPYKDYRKVFLGDMVDRGPDSFRVVAMVKKLMETEKAIVLLGNHEDMMIKYVENKWYNPQDIWLYNGGKKTMDSYGKGMKMYGHGKFFGAIGSSGHFQWLKKLLPYYETEKVWFSHAPIPVEEYRMDIHARKLHGDFRNQMDTLIWSWHGHYGIEEGDGFLYDHKKTAVYGHVHRLLSDGNLKPRIHENGIYIDTGAGCAPYAPLTAVIIEDGNYKESFQEYPRSSGIDGEILKTLALLGS